jgi:SAM-dependent methyltransferase
MRATTDRVMCDACHAPHTRAGGIWTSDLQPHAPRFDSAAAERLAAMEQGDHFWLQYRTRLFCRLVDRIAPGRGQIVELGCGGGKMLPAWQARFGTVVAVDASRDLLARARRFGRTATLIQPTYVIRRSIGSSSTWLRRSMSSSTSIPMPCSPRRDAW